MCFHIIVIWNIYFFVSLFDNSIIGQINPSLMQESKLHR